MSVNDDGRDDALAELQAMLDAGRVRVVRAEAPCGYCKVGTVRPAPLPGWPGRRACDRCGAEASL